MEDIDFLKQADLTKIKEKYISGEYTYTRLIAEASEHIVNTNECVEWANECQREKCMIALAINQNAEA